MKFTVGIIFHNEEKNLPKILGSLSFLPPHKLLLVDNASKDQSSQVATDFLTSKSIPFEMILRSENSLASARNDILYKTQTEYLYFVDADCEITVSTWPELMKGFSEMASGTCAWGGSQIFPHESDTLILLDKMRQFYLGHFGSAQMKLGRQILEVDHLSTTHVLYHVSKLKSVGGFDPRLKKSAEDLELSLRLCKAGFKLIFIPQSQIVHRIAINWKIWWRKAFRNGIWQTRLIAYNPDILKSVRPWPALLFPFIGLLSLRVWGLVVIGYFTLILILSIKAKEIRLVGAFLITHTAYATGELLGVGFAIFDKILPRKTKL